MGFLITISYKSVLLANMTSVDYEKGIDSIEDMLNSNKHLMVIRSMKVLVEADPRPQVIKLSKTIKYYDFIKRRVPPKIINGYYISKREWNMIQFLHLYAAHTSKMNLSFWDWELPATLVYTCPRGHTKARKQTSSAELHHFRCPLQAH